MTSKINVITDPELKPTHTINSVSIKNLGNFIGLSVYNPGKFLRVTCPCNVTVEYALHSIPRISTRFPCENPNHWTVKYENKPEEGKAIEQFLSSSFISEEWKYEYNQDNGALIAKHANFGQRLICKLDDTDMSSIFGTVLALCLTDLSRKPVVSNR